MSDDEKIYTAKEIAKKLRISHATVIRLIESGQLSAYRIGNQYRITQLALDDYLRRATQ